MERDESVFSSFIVSDIHICKIKSFNIVLNYSPNILFFYFEKDFLLVNL